MQITKIQLNISRLQSKQ